MEIEQLNLVDPKKWLLSTRHFEYIRYPITKELALSSGEAIGENFKKIRSKIPEEDFWMFEVLVKYVEAPIIVDNFLSEKERNKWQKEEAYPRIGVNEFFENNKLKGGFISSILSIIELVELDSMSSQCHKLFVEYKGPENLYGGYGNMTIEQKLTFTKKMEDFAKNLYQALVEKYTQ